MRGAAAQARNAQPDGGARTRFRLPPRRAMLKGQVDKRMLLENMDLLLLVMDEIVDSGLLLETDPNEVRRHCTLRARDATRSEPFAK